MTESIEKQQPQYEALPETKEVFDWITHKAIQKTDKGAPEDIVYPDGVTLGEDSENKELTLAFDNLAILKNIQTGLERERMSLIANRAGFLKIILIDENQNLEVTTIQTQESSGVDLQLRGSVETKGGELRARIKEVLEKRGGRSEIVQKIIKTARTATQSASQAAKGKIF